MFQQQTDGGLLLGGTLRCRVCLKWQQLTDIPLISSHQALSECKKEAERRYMLEEPAGKEKDLGGMC